MGSSPLTRGKHARNARGVAIPRLIPAHAGKTTVAALALHGNSAHPRSRGENRLVYWPTRSVMGSSPLTRGKPSETIFRNSSLRLIPAHAGKTSAERVTQLVHEAHPRSRGENEPAEVFTEHSDGSSPLTRGKP